MRDLPLTGVAAVAAGMAQFARAVRRYLIVNWITKAGHLSKRRQRRERCWKADRKGSHIMGDPDHRHTTDHRRRQ